eukprot:3627488-Rhodomonas_salina.4
MAGVCSRTGRADNPKSPVRKHIAGTQSMRNHGTKVALLRYAIYRVLRYCMVIAMPSAERCGVRYSDSVWCSACYACVACYATWSGIEIAYEICSVGNGSTGAYEASRPGLSPYAMSGTEIAHGIWPTRLLCHVRFCASTGSALAHLR